MIENTNIYLYFSTLVFQLCAGCKFGSSSDMESNDDKESTIWMKPSGIAIIVAIVITLIAAVIYILMHLKRKRRELMDITRDLEENDYCKTPTRSLKISSRNDDIYDKGCASSESYKDRLNSVLKIEKLEKNAIGMNISNNLIPDDNLDVDNNKLDLENSSKNVLRTSSSSKQNIKELPTIYVHVNDNSKDNHVETPKDFNENGEKKCCEDDDNVYDKGFPTSTSYKHRLNTVLQNEGDGIKNIISKSNPNLDDKQGQTQKNVDWKDVEKLIIEDNPYYGQF